MLKKISLIDSPVFLVFINLSKTGYDELKTALNEMYQLLVALEAKLQLS